METARLFLQPPENGFVSATGHDSAARGNRLESGGSCPSTGLSRSRQDAVSWRLAHRPETAGYARQVVRSVMDTWQVSENVVDSVLLVVSELVTNSLEHAQPPITLHLHLESADLCVWVGITDGGPAEGEGAWTSSCADDEHGRGLVIVDALADSHGVRIRQGEITHWACVSTQQRPDGRPDGLAPAGRTCSRSSPIPDSPL